MQEANWRLEDEKRITRAWLATAREKLAEQYRVNPEIEKRQKEIDEAKATLDQAKIDLDKIKPKTKKVINFVLKDGTEINAVMVIKLESEVKIKTEAGLFKTILKKDIDHEIADEKEIK